MGRSGPPPTPTRLKLLRGETRPSRVNYREPQPRAGLPPMPADLTPAAAAVWQRVIEDYGPTGVLTPVDGDTLRCYCEAVVRYTDTAGLLFRTGYLVRNTDGDLVKSPLNQLARDAADQVRQFARELGLTPAARVGLKADHAAAPSSRLDAYLARRRTAG